MSFELRSQEIRDQYDLLTILDSKASGLLTFNSIFLATLAIWLGYVPFNVLHILLDLVFIALLCSCWQLLNVIWLKWTPLEEIADRNPEEVAKELQFVRKRRTGIYHSAWYIAKGSIICVVVVTIVHALGVILEASGVCNGVCASFYGPDFFGNFDSESR